MATSVRTSLVAACICGPACIQVHQLGQIDEGETDEVGALDESAQDATGGEDWPETGDTESGDSETSGTETSDTESGDSEADDGDSETSGTETDDTETSDTDGPTPASCGVIDLGGDPGVEVELSLMTQWEDGSCWEVSLTNVSPDNLIWTRDLRFGGELETYWNAEGEALNVTDWRFGGTASASNILILSGETVGFGCCMTCMP
ncbi:hypothetical protein [Pseudenhygromyxa sp. WMMC2535]|uniref:hypothetical protein n=1 Tax=Pseudenhygromyxa sp. WMMC2535 TaxID=2712867 RepID=UPI001C3CB433|nr:hypothetical protein [Pseudenhygromyxa sp. WMMC2535]